MILTSNLANKMNAQCRLLEPDLFKIQSLIFIICLFVLFFWWLLGG